MSGQISDTRGGHSHTDILARNGSQITARFKRETLAARNHTNIATLFDIGPEYLSGKPRLLDPAAVQSYGASWSPDGEWVAYKRLDGKRAVLAKIASGAGALPVVVGGTENFPVRLNLAGDFPVQWPKSGNGFSMRRLKAWL